MLKRLILVKLIMLAVALLSLPVMRAQSIPARDSFIPTSIYRDDPFAAAAVVEQIDAAKFGRAEDGKPTLNSAQVWVEDEPVIFKLNIATFELRAFAWNPWPAPGANPYGDFQFPDEARFPLFKIERGPDGKPILKEELQVWAPHDLHLGSNTAFAAAHAAKAAAEAWAGRDIRWGKNGRLDIRPHFFIDFQAFHSRRAGSLFFGVVPYRLVGETEIKMFELATSWEVAAHESGHALHIALKPNSDGTDLGFKAWSESFGDQTAMWVSLRNQARVQQLLTETHGDLNQPNALTSFLEAFAALVGQGTGTREAFNDKKVSDTDEEEHERSEVLTGATYNIFLKIYAELKPALGAAEAMRQAGEIMGIFLTRAIDYTPENQMTLEDIAKAYLKVDKEFFYSRYHDALVDEFTRREIFSADSVREWQAHEAAIPRLYLLPQEGADKLEQMLQANQDKLGIGPNFSLKLQSVTQSNPFSPARGLAQTIVRVQLTEGRGASAKLLYNHGILVFRANGSLADYHSPLPEGGQTALLAGEAFAQTQALVKLNQARRFGLDEHGVPLALVRRADGQWTVEARVLRSTGPLDWMEVFTPDNPQGERREITVPPIPPDQRIRNADDLLK
jgi:hypothetical protein